VHLHLEAFFYILRTGSPWRELPAHYVTLEHDLLAVQAMVVWFGKQAKGVLRHVDGSYIKLHQHGLQGSKLKRAKQAIGPPSLHYRMNEEALSHRAVSRLRVSLLNMSAFSAQAQH